MALYNDPRYGLNTGFEIDKGAADDVMRTQTRLVVSEGRHSEKWLVDPRLKGLFKYQFGGSGYVVIPKGRIVALATNGGPNNDGRFNGYLSRMLFNALTIANGGADVSELDKNGNSYTRSANRPLGVAPYNIYEQAADATADVLPDAIIRDYIELPYFAAKADAENIHFGSAYGALKAGDLVTSDANGRFVKFSEYKQKVQNFTVTPDAGGAATVYVDQPIKDAGSVSAEVTLVSDGSAVASAAIDDVKLASGQVSFTGLGTDPVNIEVTYTSAIPSGYDQVLGKVLAVDTNLPPEGWLKWVQWTLADLKQDAAYNKTGFRLDDIVNGYPYDPSFVGNIYSSADGPMGIPGLTDGSNIEVEYTLEKIGAIQPGIAANTVHHFRLLHRPAVAGTIHIFIGGVEVTPDYVDPVSGLVVVKNPQQYAGVTDVTATYKATGQIPGLPTNWDFKGAVGAVRILLSL